MTAPSPTPALGRELDIPRRDGGSSPAYAAIPAQAERGVVVIHEIYGRQPEIDRVVDRFAAAGFAAVGPDLFRGRTKPACIRQALRTIRSGAGPFATQLDEARTWLAAESGVAEDRVGVIGFCLGGGLALAVGRRFAAVSTNYGDIPPAELLEGSPPIIGCYGGRDRIFGRHGDRLRAQLRVAGQPEPEIHVFPTVGHSFLTDGAHPVGNALSWPVFHIRYDPEVAEQAWTKILEFFRASL